MALGKLRCLSVFEVSPADVAFEGIIEVLPAGRWLIFPFATCKQPTNPLSGNIQGIFREHSGNIRIPFGELSEPNQGPFREHLRRRRRP
jgi:hypothetical protein